VLEDIFQVGVGFGFELLVGCSFALGIKRLGCAGVEVGIVSGAGVGGEIEDGDDDKDDGSQGGFHATGGRHAGDSDRQVWGVWSEDKVWVVI
jgi:hypothetical protein